MRDSIDAKKWNLITTKISGLLYKNSNILCHCEFDMQNYNKLCISAWSQDILPYH